MPEYSPLEKMMSDIVNFGEELTYMDIEDISNAFERFEQRELYFEALSKLKKKFKEEL